MTDFTLGNDINKIQEEGNSSRSTNSIIFTTEKYSTLKIKNENNTQKDISQDFNSLNNSVLQITASSNNSPESKPKNNNEMLETKNLTLNTSNYTLNTSSSLTLKKKDTRFGFTYPFLFHEGEPLIVIGPYCNYNMFNNNIYFLFIFFLYNILKK